MYSIYVKCECLENKREAFIEKMKQSGILNAIRSEKGCIKYDYYLSEKNKNEILLIEQWESKEDQQLHLTQPHMAAMREFKDDYVLKTTLGEFKLIK